MVFKTVLPWVISRYLKWKKKIEKKKNYRYATAANPLERHDVRFLQCDVRSREPTDNWPFSFTNSFMRPPPSLRWYPYFVSLTVTVTSILTAGEYCGHGRPSFLEKIKNITGKRIPISVISAKAVEVRKSLSSRCRLPLHISEQPQQLTRLLTLGQPPVSVYAFFVESNPGRAVQVMIIKWALQTVLHHNTII